MSSVNCLVSQFPPNLGVKCVASVNSFKSKTRLNALADPRLESSFFLYLKAIWHQRTVKSFTFTLQDLEPDPTTDTHTHTRKLPFNSKKHKSDFYGFLKRTKKERNRQKKESTQACWHNLWLYLLSLAWANDNFGWCGQNHRWETCHSLAVRTWISYTEAFKQPHLNVQRNIYKSYIKSVISQWCTGSQSEL